MSSDKKPDEIAKSKRKIIRTSATREGNATSEKFKEVNAANIEDAETHVAKLKRIRNELQVADKNVLDVIEMTSDDLEKELERQDEYQRFLVENIDRLEVRIRRAQLAHAPTQNSNEQNDQRRVNVKHQKLELTSFDGDPLKWEEFWDDFTCSIDSRSDLTVIDKFKLLKQSLKGEASSVADGYSLTQRNYQEVKDTLLERFGDPQTAIFAHFEALIDLPPATHEVDTLIRIRDKCEAHIRSLAALGLTEETYGLVFAPIIISKLPRFVKLEMHRQNGSKRWTLAALREHLKDEIKARTKSDKDFAKGQSESKKDKTGVSGSKKPSTANALISQGSKSSKGKGFVSKSNGRQVTCIFCKGSHQNWDCRKYPTVESRMAIVKGRCFICFRDDHMKRACQSRRSCYYCGENSHNSSLCFKHFGKKAADDRNADPAQTVDSSSTHALSTPGQSTLVQTLNPKAPEFVPAGGVETSILANPNSVQGRRSGMAILESALVSTRGSKGTAKARLVFDNGSTLSFVRTNFARQLGAKVIGQDSTMLGRFGDDCRKNRKHTLVQLELVLRNGSSMRVLLRQEDNVSAPISLNPVPLDKIGRRFHISDFTGLVTQPSNPDIDILIGLDYYYDIVGSEVWRAPSGIVVKDTAVGKILTGFLKGRVTAETGQQMLISGLSQNDQDLFDLERFWKIDEAGVVDRTDRSDDELAVELFNQSVRFVDGRYEVKWPFKEDPPNLPKNYEIALRRLISVHRKLLQTPDLLSTYDEIFKDQREKGVIEEAPVDPEGPLHYLPHHAVVIPTRETTKVRLVFDASSKPNSQFRSLNESMYRGPVFLNDLCGLLLRFRLFEFGVTSDVQKAFLQISLHKQHRDCTRFLWLRDAQEPPTADNIVIYRYARVLFGATASPFLLAATIIHHMKLVNSEVSDRIISNTYMDNIIGGFDSTEKMLEYFSEAKELFRTMNMNLHQWYSNNQEFIAAIPKAERGTREISSVLGLKWNLACDSLCCTVGTVSDTTATKRVVLRNIAKVYDPCGWFSPVTVSGKMLMQEIWKEKVGWDDPLPPSIIQKWEAILPGLRGISTHSFSRAYERSHGDKKQDFHLHVFCDASSKAYAACAYLVAKGDSVSTTLLFAKSRVAPVKELTIPKLELTAVVMGSRIIQFVERHMKLTFLSKTLWTDSLCALSWIIGDKVSTTFIRNRVREIRDVPGLEYRHVPTDSNPADLGSRGVSFEILSSKDIWWKGPAFLSSETGWPDQERLTKNIPRPEPNREESELITTTVFSASVDPVFQLDRYSSLNKLLRVTALVFRACSLFRKKAAPKGCVTASERKYSREFWEKRIQKQHFKPILSGKLDSPWKSYIRQLGLFIDADGLIRCGGRFALSESLSSESKNPILLPKASPFSRLVVADCHRKVMHFGTKHTLAELRQRYWISQGRVFVKGVLSDCRVCRRSDGGPFRVPDPPSLPSFRTSIKRPFACIGLDYLGPLFVRTAVDPKKVWIALFTCAVTRAVHLEVSKSLSANDFLLCLRRFVSIYGQPEIIVSDNARQFKAADQLLQKEFKRISEDAEVQSFLSEAGMKWIYIVERAPWMGGFYERLVAIAKEGLKKSLGKWSVSQEELQTLCYEVAFVINSRPLVYAEDDPSDKVLTPLDLLFRSNNCFPDASGEQVFQGNLARADELIAHWRAGHNLLRQFWDAWKDNYLVALRDSHRVQKGRGASPIELDVGVVVLIKENLPRGQWKVGRISKLRVSGDGQVRAAEIKMPNGSLLVRPIKLLYPLEGNLEPENKTIASPSNTGQKAANQVAQLDRNLQNTKNVLQTSRPSRQAARTARQLTRQQLSSA